MKGQRGSRSFPCVMAELAAGSDELSVWRLIADRGRRAEVEKMGNCDTHNMLKAPKRLVRAGSWVQRLLVLVSVVVLVLSTFPIVDRSANAVEPVSTEYTNLVVQKKWIGPAMADSVNYHLEAYDRASGEKVEVPGSVAGLSGTVTKDGGWRAEVTNLPAKVAGADVDYRVVEDDVPAGYTVSYSESSDFMDVDSYWVDVHLRFQLSKSTDKDLVVEYKYGDDDPQVINVPKSAAANGKSFAKGEVVEYTVKHHASIPLNGEPESVEVLSVKSDKRVVAENNTVDGGSYAKFAPASKKAALVFTPGANVSGTRVKVTYSYKGQTSSFFLESNEYGKWLKNVEYKLDITDRLPDLDGASSDLELVEIAKVDNKGNVKPPVDLVSKSAEIEDIPEHVEAALVFTAPKTIYSSNWVRFTYTYQGEEYIYEVAKGDHEKWVSGTGVEVPLPMNLEWDPNNLGKLHLTKIEVSGEDTDTTYQETCVDKGSTSELTTEAAGTIPVEVKALVMTGQPDHAFVLSKTIEGSKTVNLAMSFPFQVTITDASGKELSGEFDYRGYSSVPGQISPGDGKVKSGNTMMLAHGQGIVVSGIPDDTTVAVKELNIPEGFVASVNGVDSNEFQGAITSQNRSLVADYVNKQNDPWIPAYPDNDQNKVIVTKKIESLSTEDPFGDTTLTGDDFYRLYLDITGARDARGYDFLFIVDTTTSMTQTFDGKGYKEDWQDTPGRRIYEMDKILNGSHKQMSSNGLVSQILAANPNNRVAVGSFSGAMEGKYWKLEGDDPNAIKFARTLLDWTDIPGYVNVYDDVKGSTNYGSGFIKGAQLLDSARSDGNKKVVVFMSDGFPNHTFVDYDNGSRVDPGKGTSVRDMKHNNRDYFTKDFARFKENCRDLYGENFFNDIDFYAVGINNNETGVGILKSLTDNWAELGGCSKYYFAGNAQMLIDGYEEIISNYLVSNVSISDPLSQWVELYQDQADIKISCTHYNEEGAAANTEVVWSGSCAGGEVSGSWCGTPANGNGDNVIDSVTFTPSTDVAGTNSTGAIDVRFKPEYKLGNVTYALSFNVKVADAAKNHEGVMPDTGDPDTDKRIDMKTSSGQPGFFSNNGASAKCKMGSEFKNCPYPKPVVQVVPKNLDWGFYKVDEKDNPIEDAEFSLYRCDNAKPDHTHSSSVTVDSDCCWTAADTSTVVSAKSDSTGLVSFTGLQSGDYVLVETKTKGGYQLPAGQWRLTVDAAKGTVSDPQATEGTELPPAFKKGRIGGDSSAPGSEEVLMLPNYPSHDLPFTGIKISLWALIIGTLLVTAAAGWLAKKNHQDRATRQGNF